MLNAGNLPTGAEQAAGSKEHLFVLKVGSPEEEVAILPSEAPQPVRLGEQTLSAKGRY